MSAAKAWGLTPGEWRCLSDDDRARMMVHEWLEGARAAYEGEKMEEEAESKGGKTSGAMMRQSDHGMYYDMMRGNGPQV